MVDNQRSQHFKGNGFKKGIVNVQYIIKVKCEKLTKLTGTITVNE